MSHTNNALIELTEQIIDTLQLPDNDTTFETIQNIILTQALPLDDFTTVRDYFRDIVLCPQCQSLQGPLCNCWNEETEKT